MKIIILIMTIINLTLITGCKPSSQKATRVNKVNKTIKSKETENIKTFKNLQFIVVFKKSVTTKQAEEILSKSQINYRSGSDSSRGKAYFYKTGDKFILDFKNKKSKIKFLEKYKNQKEIYEIYEPDWNKHKD